jgi:hypothetical protein
MVAFLFRFFLFIITFIDGVCRKKYTLIENILCFVYVYVGLKELFKQRGKQTYLLIVRRLN